MKVLRIVTILILSLLCFADVVEAKGGKGNRSGYGRKRVGGGWKYSTAWSIYIKMVNPSHFPSFFEKPTYPDVAIVASLLSEKSIILLIADTVFVDLDGDGQMETLKVENRSYYTWVFNPLKTKSENKRLNYDILISAHDVEGEDVGNWRVKFTIQNPSKEDGSIKAISFRDIDDTGIPRLCVVNTKRTILYNLLPFQKNSFPEKREEFGEVKSEMVPDLPTKNDKN